MSKVDIIKMLEDSINTYVEGTKVAKVELSIEEVKIILDLYNKEKEKNNSLKKEIKNLKIQLQDIHDNFCKFNWKESNPKQVHHQLKELYESIYRKVEKDYE